MDLGRQQDLFGLALAELAGLADLVNQCLEVFGDGSGEVSITLYDIPAASPTTLAGS